MLDSALSAASASRGQVVIVEGDAGIGKTRLVAETVALARRRRFRVLRAAAAELEEDLPYAVVRQLLEPALAALAPGERAEVLGGAAGLAAPLLLLERHEDRLGAPAALLHGLFWIAANLAQRQPLLVVVDDAQWADATSLRWLGYLVRRIEGLPLTVVIAARPGERRAWHGWVTPIEREPNTTRLLLHGLSPAAVAVVVDAVLGSRTTPEVVEACAAATGGNPFLLTALLSELPAGPLAPAQVRECGPAALAPSLVARLACAGEACVAVADAIAVLGDGIPLRLVAALSRLRLPAASRAVDRLGQLGLLRHGRPVGFAHAIVRQALYDHRPAGERSLAHAAAARLLAADGQSDEHVAAHLLLSEPAGSSWVVDRLLAAARHALGQGAPDSALTYLRRAMDEPADRRDEVLLELGRAEARLSLPDASGHLRTVVERSEDPALLASAAIDLARLLLALGEPAAATDAIDGVITRVGRQDPGLALRLECERLPIAMGSVSRAGTAAQRLLTATSDPPGDGPLARLVLAQRAVTARMLRANRRECRALTIEALGGGRFLAEHGCESASYYLLCAMLVDCDELLEAQHLLDAALAEAGNHGSVYGYTFASTWRSWARLRAGDIRGALSDATAVLDLDPESGYLFHQAVAVGTLAEALAERGELARADASIEDALAVQPQDQSTSAHLWYVAARIALLAGELPAAREKALHAGQLIRRLGRDLPNLHAWRSVAAQSAAALGDLEGARRLAEEDLTNCRGYDSPRALGIALRTAALVGAPGERVGGLRRALDVLEPTECQLERAWTLFALGAALRRSGARTASRDPLRAAFALATECGALLLADRAQQELLAAGGRPRRPALRGLDALTPAELRVASHAARGLPVKTIAQQLFVTTKTVETHLTRVYRKLGVTSRQELHAAMSAPHGSSRQPTPGSTPAVPAVDQPSRRT